MVFLKSLMITGISTSSGHETLWDMCTLPIKYGQLWSSFLPILSLAIVATSIRFIPLKMKDREERVH